MFFWLIFYITFIIHINSKDVYEVISDDVEDWFYILNYEINRPLPISKKWKSNWFNQMWIRRTLFTRIAELRPKTYYYYYSTDDGNSDKKANEKKKKNVSKRELKFWRLQ